MAEGPAELAEAPAPVRGWLSEFPPRRRHLLLAGGCLAVVYLASVTGRWWPTPDSALYLGLARSLARGEGFRFNGSVNTTVTPGYPLVLAGLRILFGSGLWAPNALAALCGLGALAAMYSVIARMSDPRTAQGVVLATGLSYTFFTNAHLVLTDAPFCLLFWLILYACVRGLGGSRWWLAALGLLTTIGISIRAPGMVVLGPLALGVALEGSFRARIGRRLACGAVIFAAMTLTAGGFYLLARSAGESVPPYVAATLARPGADLAYRLRHLGLGLLKLNAALAEMLTSQDGLVPIGAAGMLLAIVGMVHLWQTKRRMVPTVLALYPIALAVLGERAIRPRYLLPVHGLFVYAAVEGLCWSMWRFRRRPTPPRPAAYLKAVTIFTALVIALNLPRLSRNAVYYTYVSYTPRYYHVIREGNAAELFEVAELIKDQAAPAEQVLVKADKVRILHFLTERGMLPHPGNSRSSVKDAQAIYDRFLADDRPSIVVLDVATGSREFLDRLKSLFAETPGLELLHSGDHYVVYRRAPGDADSAVGAAGRLVQIFLSTQRTQRC